MHIHIFSKKISKPLHHPSYPSPLLSHIGINIPPQTLLTRKYLLTNKTKKKVHVFDRQPEPGAGSKYAAVAQRAASELDTSVTYHRVDVRDGVAELNGIAREIADRRGRLDGLIAAAGIQQEAPALEYSAADADRMLGVNVTGVLMTAQAVARQMVRLGTPGSIALIASMSGSVANRGLICP